jgi:hypothetical protein
MPVRWHCEDFYFETEPDPRAARGQDADGRAVRQHDGRQEFWTGKTWIFIPAGVLVYKVPELPDGYYFNKRTGEVFTRTGAVWYYWSVPHGDWKFLQDGDEGISKDYFLRIGRLGNG